MVDTIHGVRDRLHAQDFGARHFKDRAEGVSRIGVVFHDEDADAGEEREGSSRLAE
jgi:hypothetical protein